MTVDTVVTGIGIAAPNGLGTKGFWDAVLRGESGIDRLRRFDPSGYPVQIGGEVPDFVAVDHLPSRLLPQTDHMTQLALTAAAWALEDAGVAGDEFTDYGMGVVTAASSGGFEFGHRELENLYAHGPEHVSAYQSFAWFYAVNTGQISIRHKMRGPSGVLVAEQAGGLDAVGHARRHIRKGTELVVTGGVDGGLCPWGWTMQLASGRLSTEPDPRRAYLPFDAGASGYIPGEGGAILILEEAGAARDRGVLNPYGVVAGYAATFDPPAGSGRPPALRRAIELALAEADAEPGDLDVVFADGSGLPAEDAAEAAALRAVFGVHGVPVTVPKTMTGRLYSGGGPLDVATALLAMRDNVIPPTVNLTAPNADYGLDLVLDFPRSTRVRTALVLARGYGGFNSAVLLRGR